jgi:hypothetical protein
MGVPRMHGPHFYRILLLIVSLFNSEKIKILRNKNVNFSALHLKYTRIVSFDSSDSVGSNGTKNIKPRCFLGVRASN